MEGDAGRRGRRARLIVAVVFALIALAIAALWSQRKPIATGFVDRALAARGVSARYRIARFGVYEQRLEGVSIGDPHAPDLTADWAVLHLAIGPSGPSLRGITASGVRLRGRLVDGRVTLGAVDRLLPAPSGAPFALPEIDVDLADARMRLDTAYGPLGIALEGRGKLSNGFRGRLAIASRMLDLAGCRTAQARMVVNLAIVERRPTIDGPVRADRVVCSGVVVDAPQASLDATLSSALDAWTGGARLAIAGVSAGSRRAQDLTGEIDFRGTPGGTSGGASLIAARLVADEIAGRRAGFTGRYALADGSTRLGGRASIGEAAFGDAPLRSIEAAMTTGGGTPVAPLTRALGAAMVRAGRSFRIAADVSVATRDGRGAALVRRLELASASGARLATEARVIGYAWPEGRTRIDGRVRFGGGGLPEGHIDLRQPRADAPIAGEAVIAPFSAGGARLALAPVTFTRAPGETHIATVITLDGPLGDGRVDGLTLPLTARLGARGSFLLNETCAPLDYRRLAIAGLVAGPTRLRLCPEGRALALRSPGSRVTGSASIAGPAIAGRLGKAPVTIVARRLGVAIGRPGFVADALAVRLGTAPSPSRLDIDRLEGRFVSSGIAGTFAGLGGKIGAVPLILSGGAGPWSLAGGVLDLHGTLTVADEQGAARFEPLVARDAVLRLAGGRITAGGTLREPRGETPVATVAIRHDLATGNGDAALDVPGLTFTEKLQPERLTRLTLGVVANVRGTVTGRGAIRWTGQGVTSTGTFRTDGVDLAAAFGPVKGLKGELHFTDLLGLVSAPGQIATLAEVNPGIAVSDGVIRYQLLADQMVRVEEGRWPFSGGALVLEPTVMDFGKPSERRMTFRVDGMDAAKFVEQFDFKNVAVTGVFDGTLPIIFDETGGRIERGRLAVRRGGGTLAYVGEVSNADLGMFGSLAFDALKRMRYDRLAIELNGSLDGELISRVLFDGTNETPKEAVRKNGLLSQFSNLPFRFTITIRAPFRGLLNAAQSLNDPRGLIEQARQRAVPLPGSAPPVDLGPPSAQTPVQPK